MTTPKKKTAAKSKATRSKATLAEELQDTRNKISFTEGQDAVAANAKANRIGAVRLATQDVSVEGVMQAINQIKLSTVATLDGVNQELLTAVGQLSEIREAIAAETEELETLHGKEIIATSEQQLISNYESREMALQNSFNDKQRELEAAFEKSESTLDTAIAEKKLTWKREEDKYTYDLSLSRQKDKDTYDNLRSAQQLKNEEMQRQFEQSWNKREEELKSREAELTNLRAMAQAHDAEVQKAVSKAETILKNVLTKDHTHEIDKLLTQHNASITVLSTEKKGLESANTQLATQLAEAHKTIESLSSKVETIATNAVNAASGQRALDAVMAANNRNESQPGKTKSS